MLTYEEIVDKCIQIRKYQRGLRQQDVADAIGLDRSTISQMESKKRFLPGVLDDCLRYLSANKLKMDKMQWRIETEPVSDEDWEEFQRKVRARKGDAVRKVEADDRPPEESEPEPEADPEPSESEPASDSESPDEESTPEGTTESTDPSTGDEDENQEPQTPLSALRGRNRRGP